jgi:predicted dehydrogenase
MEELMSQTENKGGVTRRDFLKSSGMGAAAGLAILGAPAILRAQNLNSQLNVGVIGTGSRGCYLIRLLDRMDGVTVTDVCDVYPPHLEEGKNDSGNEKVRAHEQWEKIIEQKDVDAVVVSPPLFLHVPCSVAALSAGKHVFSEKSQGLNVKQLNEIKAVVESHPELTYMVGYQSRLMESFKQAKELVRNNTFGKITQFYLHYDRNTSWRKDIEDPKWERVLNWRMYREYCGGILTELLSHDIDMMLDLLGTRPVKAACEGKLMTYNDGREHHDSIMGYLEMEDGVLGLASGHLSNSRWGSSWAIHGTHGTIEFMGDAFRIFWEKETRHLQGMGIDHKFNRVKLGQSLNIKEAPITEPDTVADFSDNTDRSSQAALEHFLECIHEKKTPILNLESTRLSALTGLMLYKSSLEGGRQVTMEDVLADG